MNRVGRAAWASILCIVLGAAIPGFRQRAEAVPAFVNPSFEVDATTGFQSVDPTGWTTFRTGAPPYLINNATYGNTPFGSQFLAIGGLEDGGTSFIEQTVSGFTSGASYVLSWAQSSEFTDSDKLAVSFISGSSTPGQTFTTPPYPGGSQFWFTWSNESFPFVADSASVRFHFQSFGDNYEVGVDNFQITAGTLSPVPEPTTLLLLGTSFTAMGGAVWRRKRQK